MLRRRGFLQCPGSGPRPAAPPRRSLPSRAPSRLPPRLLAVTLVGPALLALAGVAGAAPAGGTHTARALGSVDPAPATSGGGVSVVIVVASTLAAVGLVTAILMYRRARPAAAGVPGPSRPVVRAPRGPAAAARLERLLKESRHARRRYPGAPRIRRAPRLEDAAPSEDAPPLDAPSEPVPAETREADALSWRPPRRRRGLAATRRRTARRARRLSRRLTGRPARRPAPGTAPAPARPAPLGSGLALGVALTSLAAVGVTVASVVLAAVWI